MLGQFRMRAMTVNMMVGATRLQSLGLLLHPLGLAAVGRYKMATNLTPMKSHHFNTPHLTTV